MHRYVFECQVEGCALRFERSLRMADHPTHACPECGEPAPRVLDQEGFAFAFAPSESASPANTGVHKDDYPTADRIVGKDADMRWAQYDEQAKVKNAAREKGQTHALIRHQGSDFIDYEPMTDVGLDARKKLFKRAVQATEVARKVRDPR